MSEHTWFQENLAGYCAGGLTVEEGERFQRHRIACAACAALLAEGKEFDQTMDSLFAPVRPAAGWENRVIETLHCPMDTKSQLVKVGTHRRECSRAGGPRRTGLSPARLRCGG